MLFSGTYNPSDVLFFLRNDESIPLLSREEKERRMASGVHYSDLLSLEDEPQLELLFEFKKNFARNGKRLARDIMYLAKRIQTQKNPVLLSLVRAGVPLGCLLRRAIMRLGQLIPHYGISIIRDRGIDKAALHFIRAMHPDGNFVFVDGWTGKGTIARELKREIPDAFLAVLTDPAQVADLTASYDDWAIPFGMLNGCISGCISRSVWNEPSEGFHRCRQFSVEHDLSEAFLDQTEALFDTGQKMLPVPAPTISAEATLTRIMETYGIQDRNKVKPGIAEAGRALFRRTPRKLLLAHDIGEDGDFLCLQAVKRGIQPETADIAPYKAIAILT